MREFESHGGGEEGEGQVGQEDGVDEEEESIWELKETLIIIMLNMERIICLQVGIGFDRYRQSLKREGNWIEFN